MRIQYLMAIAAAMLLSQSDAVRAQSPARVVHSQRSDEMPDLDALIAQAGRELDGAQPLEPLEPVPEGTHAAPYVDPVGPAHSCAGGCTECGDCGGACSTACGCDASCATACVMPCPPACEPRVFAHRTGAFGEYIFLQPSGADVAYVQPRDGLDPLTSVPFGPVSVVDPDYQPGARIGGSFALDGCSSIRGTYTWYESSTSDSVAIDVPNSLNSLLIYSGAFRAASTSLLADAAYDIDFQLIDVDYRATLFNTNRTQINYLLGARYGQLDQELISNQQASPGTTTVESDIDFDGAGIRVGLEGERRCCNNGLFVYGRGTASFLVGEYRSSFVQTNTFAGVQAQTAWDDDRITSVLEYEIGVGWSSRGGRLHLSAGYLVAAWYNAVTTPTWIDAVQADNFVDVGDTLTFDGLTARVEVGW